jgi:hypothetical protein
MVGVRPGVCVTDSRGFLPRSTCPPRAAASRTYVAVESGSARLVAITCGTAPRGCGLRLNPGVAVE